MGGYIALEYISRYSNDVSGLGLFHSTATADSDEKKAERLKTIQFIEKHGTEAFIKNFYPNMFSEDFIASNFDLVEEFTKKVHKSAEGETVVRYHAFDLVEFC